MIGAIKGDTRRLDYRLNNTQLASSRFFGIMVVRVPQLDLKTMLAIISALTAP